MHVTWSFLFNCIYLQSLNNFTQQNIDEKLFLFLRVYYNTYMHFNLLFNWFFLYIFQIVLYIYIHEGTFFE